MKTRIIYGVGIAVVIALVNSFFVDIYGIENESVRTFLGFLPLVVTGVGLFFAMRKTKKEIYNQLITDYPNTKLSLSKFYKLYPKNYKKASKFTDMYSIYINGKKLEKKLENTNNQKLVEEV